jgi:hypothetical protein
MGLLLDFVGERAWLRRARTYALNQKAVHVSEEGIPARIAMQVAQQRAGASARPPLRGGREDRSRPRHGYLRRGNGTPVTKRPPLAKRGLNAFRADRGNARYPLRARSFNVSLELEDKTFVALDFIAPNARIRLLAS